MCEVMWKKLEITPKEEELARQIVEGGAGKSLGKEQLEQYQVKQEWDIKVDTKVGKTLVHLYRPKTENEKIPLFLNIHGGGFIKGRRDQDIVFCRNFGSRSGCMIADIDYVPSPGMRYPGQVYACYDVLQYFAEHADEMGIDRERIAMGGHSAGGNLTAAAILMAIDEGNFVPALQILDYAALDLATPCEKKRNGISNPRIPAWKSDFYNKMYVNQEDVGQVYCSPALASDEQLAKMPPSIIISCDSDSFCDEDETFASRLMKMGVLVYARRFYHSDHGFTVQRKGEYQDAENMILFGLRTFLKE